MTGMDGMHFVSAVAIEGRPLNRWVGMLTAKGGPVEIDTVRTILDR